MTHVTGVAPAVTGEQVELAYVGQAYTGEQAAADAATHCISLEAVQRPGAKRGLVLRPRRWVVPRPLGWLARFQRLVPDYERLAETVEALTFVAFACLMLHRLVHAFSSQQAPDAKEPPRLLQTTQHLLFSLSAAARRPAVSEVGPRVRP